MADAIDARYGSDANSALSEQVAKALFNKAIYLSHLGRREEALAVADAIDARYGSHPAQALREQVAKALSNKAVHLASLGHCEDAVAIARRDRRALWG